MVKEWMHQFREDRKLGFTWSPGNVLQGISINVPNLNCTSDPLPETIGVATKFASYRSYSNLNRYVIVNV